MRGGRGERGGEGGGGVLLRTNHRNVILGTQNRSSVTSL